MAGARVPGPGRQLDRLAGPRLIVVDDYAKVAADSETEESEVDDEAPGVRTIGMGGQRACVLWPVGRLVLVTAGLAAGLVSLTLLRTKQRKLGTRGSVGLQDGADAPTLRGLLGGADCGLVADATDLWTRRPTVAQIPEISSFEACAAQCLLNPQCSIWTWGKARGVPFLSDVCFLKALESDEEPTRVPKDTVLSGSMPCSALPPPTLAAPAEASVSAAATAGPPVSRPLAASEPASALAPATPPPTSSMEAPPQAPASAAAGLLFCFSLVIPDSYEVALLAMQVQQRASIFACDTAAVYSNRPIQVAPGVVASVVDSDLKCDVGGEFRTALNLGIFEKVWQKVIADGYWVKHDWTVKVDADAVFFPRLLRPLLAQHPDLPEGVYLNNCKYGLHGPLEVFSRRAVQMWAGGMTRCKDYFWGLCGGHDCGWGEDMFIDQCFQRVLGVKRESEYTLLTEDHCPPSPDHPFPAWNTRMCSGGGKIAYHPFKDPAEYQACIAMASQR